MSRKIGWVVTVLACSLASCAPPPLSAQSYKLLQLRVALGVGYMRQGELGLARNELARALDMDPTDASANSAMAIVQERLHEPAKARHFFRVGLANHPNNGSLQNNYGAFLCASGHVKEALGHFRAALNAPLYPTPQLADLNMGVCLLKTPDTQTAIHYFHKAQALAPQLPGPYYYMARIRYQKHENERAMADIHQYLGLVHNAQGLFLGVQIGRAANGTKFTRYCATRLLSTFPNTTQARTVEGWQRKGLLLGH
ncbi:MAG TPA: type IV pilus biogenesis/stability protein PilW [Acidiferrobacter sp.]|nr:type IV pilus biogenesis/stability protein PilW [Acidiferrobacter sp.]